MLDSLASTAMASVSSATSFGTHGDDRFLNRAGPGSRACADVVVTGTPRATIGSTMTAFLHDDANGRLLLPSSKAASRARFLLTVGSREIERPSAVGRVNRHRGDDVESIAGVQAKQTLDALR
jgi:hypothetical protein